VEMNKIWSLQLHISRADVEDFLYTSASIEECQKKGAVSHAIPSPAVHGRKHGTDFIRVEVLNGANRPALARHGKQALAGLNSLWASSCHKAGEGVDGRQPRISRGHAAFAIHLKMIQEGDQVLRAEVAKVQTNHVTLMTYREKPKQQYKTVPITRDCLWAEPTREWKMTGKEIAKHGGKSVGQWIFH
jgi:hypothetical protein